MTQNQTMVYKPGLAGFLPARKKTGYSRKERGRPATEGFYAGFLFTVYSGVQTADHKTA